MADNNQSCDRGSNVERGNNMNFSTAIGLLRQATNILAGTSSSATPARSNRGQYGEPSSTISTPPTPPTPSSSPSTASTAQTVRDSAVLSNFRDLFSPYRSVASSSQTAQPQRPKNTSRRANRFVPYKVKETWTHEFFLFSDPGQTILPTKSEKIKLQDVGLGRKKIVFGNKDGAMEVMSKLEEIYPKLKEGGGFEILRSGVKNELAVVTPPVGGYTVSFLRDQSGLAQAIAYIRPLQSRLSMVNTSATAMDCADVATTSNTPKVNCVKCGVEILVTQVRIHQKTCSNITCKVMASTKSFDEHHGLSDEPNQSIENQASVDELTSLFPTENEDSIRDVLIGCGGNTELAASQLIHWECSPATGQGSSACNTITIDYEDSNTADSSAAISNPTLLYEEDDDIDPVKRYRQQTLNTNTPPMRIYVNRMQEEFTADVLTIYKKPDQGLRSKTRVKFENEMAVGEGPVREFFSTLMEMVQHGFALDGLQQTNVFEGQHDHKLPVPNVLLRNSGFFISVGRMIAHSFLHGGPLLYGLSPAVISFWCCDGIDAITVDDVPDYELRQAILQLTCLHKDKEPVDELKEFLLPYRDEAAVLQVPLSGETRHLAIQQILVHNVIEKRRNELTDLATGMNELSLVSYLKEHDEMVKFVFPREAESVIDKENVKSKILLENSDMPQGEVVVDFLCKFIDDISQEAEAGAGLKDLLAFWTGWEVVPAQSENLIVALDDTKTASSLVESKACFNKLILSSANMEYSTFKTMMSKALKFGSRGYTSI